MMQKIKLQNVTAVEGPKKMAVANPSATTPTIHLLYSSAQNQIKFQNFCLPRSYRHLRKLNFGTAAKFYHPVGRTRKFSCNCLSAGTTSYEFSDGSSEVELRLKLGGGEVPSPKDVFVNADGTSLSVRVRRSGFPITLMETNSLFGRIKPSETIWYIDDDELVINMKKQDPDLKWPDVIESWESLAAGSVQLLKGTSIYIVGDSTEINQKVARELAVGLGYTPLETKDLLETIYKRTVDSWVLSDGSESVAEGEGAVLESLSSHVRAVVATLGGQHGAALRRDQWRHLYSGFTVWLSQTEATDEASAKDEARKHYEDGEVGYSNADVVVKLQGWDPGHAKSVAQASLSALKQLILSDRELPGKKNLYIRLGCRGDWPNIKPPGWDPATASKSSSPAL